MRKSAAFEMVSIIVDECVCPPPEPVTVSGYVPAVAVFDTATVSVDVYVGVPLVGFSDAVTPAGWPETVSVTVFGVPLFRFTFTEAV